MPKPPPSPVIVVPGVTATWLRDHYPLPPEMIWGVLEPSKRYERAQMHPSDLRYEASQPADVRADQVYEVAYAELIEELRYNLSRSPAEPIPVFPFGYDWRHPLAITEQRLAEFVEGVIARTKLLRHYDESGYAAAPKVNLVGHSMGGLVIAGYIERFGGGLVDRVATLASPFRGSFEAMVKIATGTANLGVPAPSSREREAARVTPSIYHLLPDFDTGVDPEEGSSLPRSTFDPGLMQPSIVESVVSYAERFALGRTKKKRTETGKALLPAMLAEAERHRKRIAALDLQAKGLSADRWLCVVGVDAATRVRMGIGSESGRPAFRLTSKDLENKWRKKAGDRRLTGDGTVHFLGAEPAFLKRKNLICVTPDDFGIWELQDRAVARLAGFHGILPNMNMLHRLIVRFFTGADDRHGNTWGAPAPGVSAEDWSPAVTGLKLKAVIFDPDD